MELHDFMCQRVHPETTRLLRAPELMAAYPRSGLMVIDLARDRLFQQGIRRTSDVFETPIAGVDLEETLAPVTTKPRRTIEVLTRLQELGAQRAVANMMDATPFAPELYFGFPVNILQYNRRRGDRSAALWRLPDYFEPTPMLGNMREESLQDTLAFADKRPLVFWRGSGQATHWQTPFLSRYLDLPMSEEALLSQREQSVRAASVLYSRANPDFTDIRFAVSRRQFRKFGPGSIATGFTLRFESIETMLQNRYVLCLPGNDVGSQLYWLIGTNSVPFVVESDYEVIPDFFLKPWVHYVPVQRNLSDLREKFDFCEANPDFCRALIDRANAARAEAIDPALWEEAELKVLDKLGFLAA